MPSDLMDTEPGGENTQYESIKTVTEPHLKEAGQLATKDTQSSTESAQEQEERARRGEKTAENVRYGQALSEQGFGGKTTEKTGHSIKDASGLKAEDRDAEQSRQAQGYGPGSGVGA